MFSNVALDPLETAVDDMAQNIVKAAAAVGLGGALAQTEVKPAEAKESINYAEAYAYLYEEYEQQLDEIDIAGIAKKGAKKLGGVVNKGLDKAGDAVETDRNWKSSKRC